MKNKKLTVHYMQYGTAACGREGPPAKWPEGHVWSASWGDITCVDCLLGREEIKTYTLSPDEKAITCLRCKKTSFHPQDVANHYCGYCNVFHDDIWVPARRWWINSLAA